MITTHALISSRIAEGRTTLGIELGSTRIKAVLIDDEHRPIASGDHEWENAYVDGRWTYSLEAVESGLQAAYAAAETGAELPWPARRAGQRTRSLVRSLYASQESRTRFLSVLCQW